MAEYDYESAIIAKLPNPTAMSLRQDPERTLGKAGVNKAEFAYANAVYFRELYTSALQSTCSSYVTFADEKLSQGQTLDEVSVVKKNLGRDLKYAYTEVVASRIYNHFGIPTTYNLLCQEIQDNTPTVSLLSVNFLRTGDKFVKLGTGADKITHTSHPREWLKEMNSQIVNFYNNQDIPNKDEVIQRTQKVVAKAFLTKYLVSTQICKDKDYSFDNEGWVINEDAGTIGLAPSLDFEYCFSFLPDNMSDTQDKLRYIRECIPDEYDSIIEKLRSSIIPSVRSGKSDIDRIVSGAIKEDVSGYSEYFSNRIRENCTRLLEAHDATFGATKTHDEHELE